MVDYSEDGVISVVIGELCDQIHSYNFERLGCRGNVNLVWWRDGSVRKRFVLLALGASLDVVFNPFGHSGPPGDPFGGVDGPVSSYMCCRRFVVYQLQEISFEFVVWGEYHFAFVFPEAYGWFHG